MIPRYKNPSISKIWSKELTLDRWLLVEMSHLKAMLNEGVIGKEEYQKVATSVVIDKRRWKEIESITKHDLQAFVQMLEESVGNKASRWIHYGLTSSDIIDTSLSIAISKTLDKTIEYLTTCKLKIESLVEKNTNTLILGRTHGRAAETYSLSLLFKRWSSLIVDCIVKCSEAATSCSVGKLSGPCGNNATLNKKVEAAALDIISTKESLSPHLRVSGASSQIISRSIYLDYFYAMLKCALAFEKIANDIRFYSIEGIDEMSEGFTAGQKGSSAMPHKRNPVKCENLVGLSRMCKGYFHTAVDNCNTLWERDISNSASERIIFKDMAHLVCFGVNRLSSIIDSLSVNQDEIKRNIKSVKNKVNSQKKMNKYIAEGLSRAEAHSKVQKEF